MDMEYVWLIWDLAALLIIALCVFRAAWNGFVGTVVRFFSYIVGAVAASALSAPAAVWLYENAVGGFVKGALTGSLRETLAKNGGANEFAENAPVWLRGSFAIMPEGGLESLDLSQNAARAVDIFVDQALREPIIWVLSGIIFLFLFAILVYLVKQLASLFTFVDRIPLIGTVNTVMGGVLGVAESVIILLVIAIMAHIFITLSGGAFSFANTAVFERSFLMRFFYHLTAF